MPASAPRPTLPDPRRPARWIALMRVGAATLVVLGAVAALVGARRHRPDPAGHGSPHRGVRPWVAARALGVTAYLLLALQVGLRAAC